MNNPKRQNRLIRALAEAYRASPSDLPLPDSQWRDETMGIVRRLGTKSAQVPEGGGLGWLAWRLAPVAAALMVILGLLLMRTGSLLEYQIASYVAADPAGLYAAFLPY